MQTAFQSLDYSDQGALYLDSILRVPNIMSYELFNGFLPLFLQEWLLAHDLQLVHQAVYIFDQYIITCYEHLFLLLRLIQHRSSLLTLHLQRLLLLLVRGLLSTLTLISSHRSVGVLVVLLLPGVGLWSCFVVHGYASWLLSFFVRSRLNLSLSRSSVHILGAARRSVLVDLFILLIWSRW